MKIARHWKRAAVRINGSKGKPMDAVAWGWSANDPAEAETRAAESVQRLATRLVSGERFPDSYGYPDRPAREEIIREITGEDGELTAFISRNSYGSLVLNTARLMFIDIDVTPHQHGLLDLVMSIFGRPKPDAFENALEQIRRVAAGLPQYSFRVYRTAAGFRLMVVNKRIDPVGEESKMLLKSFGSDALYQRLCTLQESFRARLTPKHWRCRCESPRGRWPFDSAGEEARYRNWELDYKARSAAFATCSFVTDIGTERPFSEFRELITLHDRETRSDSRLPLA
ncbi:MAG: hypothetical protein QUS14_01985 [Pyrinomonadaceae bacterium]|nr:hypothetical protein [Pyrinomonadaceae bacterium]